MNNDAPQKTLRTRTVLLYDEEAEHRKRVVAHFSKYEIRVVCLDMIEQVVLQAKRAQPFAVLFNPFNAKKKTLQVVHALLHHSDTQKIPIFIIESTLKSNEVTLFLEMGVVNVLDSRTSVEALLPIVISRRPYLKNLKEQGMTIVEKAFPNGMQYEWVQLKFNLSSRILRGLKDLAKHKHSLESQYICLDLYYADHISKPILEALIEWLKTLDLQGATPVIFHLPVPLQPILKIGRTEFYPSHEEFYNIKTEGMDRVPIEEKDAMDLLADLPDLEDEDLDEEL